MTVQIKKSGQLNYLNEEEESLVVALAYIESVHGLPLNFLGVAQQFQNVVKDVKSRCDDYDIK